MIRTTTSKVDLDFSGRSIRAGEIELASRPSPKGGPYRKASLPIEAVAWVEDGTPDKTLEVAVLHAEPDELRRFCEDTVRKLDEAERNQR